MKPERVSRSRKRRTKDRKKDRSRSRRRRRVSPSREPETVEVKVEPYTDDEDEDTPAVAELPEESTHLGGEEVTDPAPEGRELRERRSPQEDRGRGETGDRSPRHGSGARLEPREPSHPPPAREAAAWRGLIPRADRYRPQNRSPYRGINKGAKKRERQKAYREDHFEDRRKY